MLSWQIGDVKVTCILETQLELPIDGLIAGVDTERLTPHLSWLQPSFLAENLDLRVAIQAMLIETSGRKVVVDTCIGNDREIPDLPVLQTAFLRDLEGVGFTRDSVDLVLCTHLHLDHVGWNTMLVDGQWVPTFTNATYLFGEAEYAFWNGNDHDSIDLRDTVEPIVAAGMCHFIPTDFALTEEVRLQHTPGHTPGHVSVLIESQGEHAIVAGDVLHNPIQMIEHTWASLPDWDRDEAAATRKRLLADLAGTSTLLIGTHFAAPTAGYVVRSSPEEFVLADRPG